MGNFFISHQKLKYVTHIPLSSSCVIKMHVIPHKTVIPQKTVIYVFRWEWLTHPRQVIQINKQHFHLPSFLFGGLFFFFSFFFLFCFLLFVGLFVDGCGFFCLFYFVLFFGEMNQSGMLECRSKGNSNCNFPSVFCFVWIVYTRWSSTFLLEAASSRQWKETCLFPWTLSGIFTIDWPNFSSRLSRRLQTIDKTFRQNPFLA